MRIRSSHAWYRSTAAGLAMLLTLSLAAPATAAPGSPNATAAGAAPTVEPSEPDKVKSVNGTNATQLPAAPAGKAPAAGRAAQSWPAAGAAQVSVPVPSGGGARPVLAGQARAGALPVWVEHTAKNSPAKVGVRLSHRAGGDAVVVSVRRADGVAAAGPVRLTVDYSGFRDANGGDWAARLRLVARDGSPVPGVRNDLRTGRVSGNVLVGARDSEFAVAAAPEGSTGDYKATSLAPSGKWQVATHTGAFSWGYGLRAPPVPGGLGPELSASYNSNAVDGRTVSTNAQPSWLGEGWSLWPGFIERSYKGCADDLGGNNGQTKTGDLCWETENSTLSFGDHSGQLVLQGGTWRLKDDDGTRVEHLLGASNGDQGDGVAGVGEHWKVTTTDGTQYFFGRRTDSAWTVPVFGNDAGKPGEPDEPCKRDTFDASQCTQAYRWNLDYVVDQHGNSLTYHYAPETNLYGVNLAKRTASYTRGGTLTRIEYGTRDGQPGQAPARVVFETADRCTANCAAHNAGSWPDVPWDQECLSGTCATTVSPTFWSTKRLANATTQVSTGGGNYRNVDQWVFAHSFPAPGDNTTAALWLTGITHTGLAAESPITLPAVSFVGTMMHNRVNSEGDGLPKLNKNRITAIKTESGGAINISYAAPDCAPGSTPAADTNTKRCFPVRWAMPPEPTPRDDWFHKYVVTQILDDDLVGGAPQVGNKKQVTNYDYVGGGAWAYDDNPLIEQAKRTWSQWRGFEKVVVRKGDPPNDENKPESATQHQYFRGMHGDKLAGGGSKTVNITDSTGTPTTDAEPLAGFERETIVKNGVGGAEVTGEIHTPWSRLTATQGALKAYQVENTRTVARTNRLYGDDRITRVDTTYDEHGNPTQLNDAGDLADTTDDRCTTTSYAKNTTTLLVNLPATVKTIGVACGSTPSFPADAITDTRTYYDNGGLGGQPGKGDATKTEVAKDYDGSAAGYLNDKRTTYDTYGRPLQALDALGRKTTTSYTETNGLTTSSTVTNALGHDTTTTLDPATGHPAKVVDPNLRTTSLTYDALGRLAEVWKPGRTKANAADSPHLRYRYGIRNDAASWVKTETLKAKGNHVVSYTLLDGFLRERQTQAPSPQGGRILTDTLYDSRGLVNVTRAPYWHKDAAPDTTLFLPNAGEVPNATVKVYDGAERETLSMYTKFNQVQQGWSTTTGYGGDHVTVVPPSGGTTTLTIKDARDRTTHLRQYKSDTDYDETTYTYTKRGDLASVTDPAGNIWRYSYDVLGRRVRADDPDHGTATRTYDDAGQLLTTTDARGKTIATVHDDLGRQTETRVGSPSGTMLTRSVYDTLSKGAPTSSTRYADGNAYTKTTTGYDEAGHPKGETLTIPPAEAELAGTYTTSMTYAADGSPASTALPALSNQVGAETLIHDYDDLGQPDTLTGAAPYVTDTKYTALGEPTQLEIGAEGKRLWRTTYREQGTRRVDKVLTEREQVNGVMVHDQTYAYDPAGDITKITDRTAGSAPDAQCFRYDYLRRVTSAWTATDDCAAAPSATLIGGPAPYWHQYTHDPTGNRTAHTKKGLGGAADTLSTYTYPTSGDGADRPHAVTTIRTGAQTGTYGYDQAGNTLTRPGPAGPQTLTWNDEGLLTSITAGNNTTGYLYTADGNQLIRRDPGSATLYVGGGEIKLDTATKTKTGTRYYEQLGTRNAAGLTWTIADHHGTPQVAINPTTLAPTTRRLDLFGNPRNTTTTRTAAKPAATQPNTLAAGWPGGDRGFLGGTTNDTTGLTRLGAREYDPTLGKFLSTDPIHDPNNPQQLNPYTYSNNNPATFTDPTGLQWDSSTDGVKGTWVPRAKPRSMSTGQLGCLLAHPRQRCVSAQGPYTRENEWRRPWIPIRTPKPKPVPVAPRKEPPRKESTGTRRPTLIPISQPPARGSVSVCLGGALAFFAGVGLDGCFSADSHGVTLNGSVKRYGTNGGTLAGSLSIQYSTDNASQVNNGTSFYAQGSVELAAGRGGEAASGLERSDDGHVSGYAQVGAVSGYSDAFGEAGVKHGGNTGYLRWPFVSGQRYIVDVPCEVCRFNPPTSSPSTDIA